MPLQHLGKACYHLHIFLDLCSQYVCIVFIALLQIVILDVLFDLAVNKFGLILVVEAGIGHFVAQINELFCATLNMMSLDAFLSFVEQEFKVLLSLFDLQLFV